MSERGDILMPSSVLTSKGQITLLAEIRREMGLKSGDRLEFTRNAETGSYLVTRILDLRGIVEYDGAAATIEEMNEAVEQAAVDDTCVRRVTIHQP